MNHSSLTVAIGTDHAGFPLKQPIIDLLESMGHSVLDFGCNSSDACDYPDFIRPAAEAVPQGKADCAIVLGGSGNGEAPEPDFFARCSCTCFSPVSRLSI